MKTKNLILSIISGVGLITSALGQTYQCPASVEVENGKVVSLPAIFSSYYDAAQPSGEYVYCSSTGMNGARPPQIENGKVTCNYVNPAHQQNYPLIVYTQASNYKPANNNWTKKSSSSYLCNYYDVKKCSFQDNN